MQKCWMKMLCILPKQELNEKKIQLQWLSLLANKVADICTCISLGVG